MMKRLASLAVFCALSSTCLAEHYAHTEFPRQVIIGRKTFFDFGPPFQFFEIFVLHSGAKETSVERAALTPPGQACLQPATVEFAKVAIKESLQSLLAGKNPCEIPEKALRKEIKRCKKCLVFSGSDLVMQFQCGNATRKARMKVLEQDWFDQSPRTPTNTSWSMTLLDRLDAALGSKLLDRPTFPLDDPNASPPQLPLSELAEAIRRGDYDNLFDDTDHRPSAMFADAQKVVPQPSVTLLSLTPFKPTELVLPNYPAIAKAARVGGKLTVDLDVNAQGQIANVAMTGPKLLQSATEKAVTSWKFGTEAGSSHVQAVFRFDLNCEVKASVH